MTVPGPGTYFLPQVCTEYILFSSTMYRVCTEYIPVHTRKKCMFWSTDLRLKVFTRYILLVHTTMIKWYVPVCTQYIPVHTFFIDLVLHFFRFCRVYTGTYWGLLGTYFAVYAYFAGLQGAAGLPASDSCTGTRIQPKHTTTSGLLTAAWQDPCQCLPVHDITTGHLRWLAGGCSCGGSALHDSPSSNSEMMISSLLTSSASPSQWCARQ